MSIRQVMALLFGLREPVERVPYLVAGVALMGLRYGVDALLVWGVTGQFWEPWRYMSPVYMLREGHLDLPVWLMAVMGVWMLPFLWIGVSMSVRRSINAGLGAGTGLLFLVPVVNFLMIAMLCTVPSRPSPPMDESRLEGEHAVLSALKGMGAAVLLAVVATAVSTLIFGSYGVTLFVATPFAIGFFVAWFMNREASRGIKDTIGTTVLAVVLSGAALLLFALEGLFCLIMALPLGVGIGVMGALVGRGVALARRGRLPAAGVLIALPFLLGAEQLQPEPPIREVVTAVEIDAPPHVVWRNVVGFSELPEDDLPWFFAVGIAYPQRATIEGEGVGAVRYCEFSTGPFVEPITVWDPPARLAFDVVEQPPGMHEWSPWERVHAPHVDGWIQSHRGEFRLIELPGGRTRLEGSTWYHLDMAPQIYWTVFSDWLLHQIHRRVLEHVRTLSEQDHATALR